MSTHKNGSRRMTIRDIILKKTRDSGDSRALADPIVCLTAYTAPIAYMADQCADLILVGDSLGMVLYGMESTVSVSLDMMINHGRAVVKSTDKALIVIDMPFGSYQESAAMAFHHAALIMKETGAAAVKLEGGVEMAETVSFLSERGIAVMGHIGLQPQSVHAIGGYRVMGRTHEEQDKIINDARAIESAGAFALVLECVDPDLAMKVTQEVSIPTIGIGASSCCDGQILVTEDMLGLSGHGQGHKVPKFVKKYASVAADIEKALTCYADDVRARRFPAADHVYKSALNRKK